MGGVFKNLIYLFSCGYSVYYFIALIIECYILAPLLIRYNNYRTLCVVILISVTFTFVVEYIRFVQGIEVPLIIRGSFPPLLIFFYSGVYLSKHSRNYSLLFPIGMIAIGLILGILHMQYISIHYGYGELRTGQKLSLYIFDAGVILLCMSKKCESLYRSNTLSRIILYIGEISFGIYFTHVYLIYQADRFFPRMRESWIFLWLFSLLLTIGIIHICKKISPTLARKYLGYR